MGLGSLIIGVAIGAGTIYVLGQAKLASAIDNVTDVIEILPIFDPPPHPG